MLAKLRLEEFALAAVSPAQDTRSLALADLEESPEYDRGYSDGLEQATREARAEAARFADLVADTLLDLAMSVSEARASSQARFALILDALFEKIAPEIATNILGLRLIEYLGDLAAAACEAPVSVRVATANVATIEKTLAAANRDIAVVADLKLLPHEVDVDWGTGIGKIDLDHCIAQCRSVIADYFNPQPEGSERGPA